MTKKYSIFILGFGLLGLILFQREVVLPFVYKVVGSDLFLVDTDDKADMETVVDEYTDMAFVQCNNYIKKELSDEFSLSFSEKALNAWSIGDHQYVINGEVEVSKPNSENSIKRYVCRISYDKKTDQSGLMDSNNWSVYGLSGIEEI
ncbi:hypothetical protein GO003_002645 [Methylicorpusculum oleiharenae]|uniref:hypothetical protein n=1 Tax=Methylicorpusculum oleiharenae TaxID=1338687 RepID=UPI001E3039E5|nr:hypothetical protein [Methylicorpusculum oleiharenae]MCD2449287.1 hypothetical protein [Methylicorpusculum oleiharenae]